MSRRSDPEGDGQRARFLQLLEQAAERCQKIVFWWRDDDAEDATPQLDQLVEMSRRFDLPLGLAVVPRGATEALAARLAGEKRIAVLQHGFGHLRHSPEGEKKAEFGDHRPLADMQSELEAGKDKLRRLFPNLLPVLVPPWNRIGETGDAARRAAGLTGLSLYGPKREPDPHLVNTHLDIFDWKGTRGPMARAQAYSILCDEVERRIGGDAEPIGILSHHLIHQDASWALLEEVFAALRRHPAVDWPQIPDVFGLESDR
ncbi:MAG TPA: polysaccharide deacetylase family protein [Propylenella sp.]|nr:polysaccharide deacetylase family protein [Propylenella sp.]